MDQQTTQVQEDTSPINIQIVDFQITKHVVYTIKGDDRIGQFEAVRRYNDFHNLRIVLLQRWPGCYVPPIPSKQAMGNNEPKMIEDRKRFLQYFLEQMAKLRHLYFSDEFQTFLRTKNTDVEKAFAGLPKQSVLEVCQKFKANFAHLNGKEINTEMQFKSQSFQTYLLKSLKTLETLKEQVKQLSAYKKSYTDQFTNMTQVLVPDYEKNILIEYVNQKSENLIFTNHNQVNVTGREIRDLTTATNNFDFLVDLVRIECREVDAFLETLQQKEFCEKLKKTNFEKLKEQQSELSKLIAGKTTLKSIFTKGSNTEQATLLEKKISETQSEIENVNLLCDLITLLLCHEEIDRFKFNKQRKYYEILFKVSQLELELNQKVFLLFINQFLVFEILGRSLQRNSGRGSSRVIIKIIQKNNKQIFKNMQELQYLKRKFKALKIQDDESPRPKKKVDAKDQEDNQLILMGKQINSLSLVTPLNTLQPIIYQQKLSTALVLYNDRLSKLSEDSYNPIFQIPRPIKMRQRSQDQKQVNNIDKSN